MERKTHQAKRGKAFGGFLLLGTKWNETTLLPPLKGGGREWFVGRQRFGWLGRAGSDEGQDANRDGVDR